jgi:NADH:ubiquinone oxidoreductase subunit 2 (subunit N)
VYNNIFDYTFIFNKLLSVYLIIYFIIYFLNLYLLLNVLGNYTFNSNNFLSIIKSSLFNKYNYYYLLLVFSSLIGIPPLSTFVTKFMLLYVISYKNNILILLGFYLLIILNIFFYIQFLKLLKKVELTHLDLLKVVNNKHSINKFNKILLNNILIFFIFFFFFFFKDTIFVLYCILF